MKIQKFQQENPTNTQQTQFKGFGDIALRYLATNQAVGANAVDLCFMVTPRSTSDFIRRGDDAGWETLRRESMGMINDTCLGLYGASAGLLIATLMGIDNKFGEIKPNKILAAPETLNILAENKALQIESNQSDLEYLKNILRNIKAFNPNAKGVEISEDGFVKLDNATIDEIAEIFNEKLSKNVKYNDWSKKDADKSLEVVIHKITEKTGAQSKYVLSSSDGKTISETNLKTLLEDIYKISNAFNQPKVKAAFEEQVRNGKTIADNSFMKTMKKYMFAKSCAGFGLAALVGVSAQPINMYLTKKKTGSDGFVGVEGRQKDDSKGFLALRLATGFVGFSGVLASLHCNFKNLKGLPKEFMEKMAFKSFWPTINQLKGVYGITILSRILSTRDKDELRESVTKDTLGFTSWLILGDIVNKMVAEFVDKSTMNRTQETENVGFFKRVFNSTLKTRDEVLISTLAENGVSTVKQDGEKTVVKSFKEMLKDLDKLPDAIKKVTKKRLRTLNGAQCAGYLFSGLVLGLGIPNLNIAITNHLDKKRKAEAAKKMEAHRA